MDTNFRKNGIAIARGNRERFGKPNTVSGWRQLNDAELNAWYESDESKGMDCAGESKLPPRDTYFDINEGTIVHILRARAKATKGWHSIRNCMEIMLPSGEVVFTRKSDFKPIS